MSLTSADLTAVTAILRAAARAEIMPRFRRLAPGMIRTKSGPADLVTDADEAAERAITAALHTRFPGCLVVGEEATARDPALPARLATADLAFLVDPVDGTSNFVAGLPLFGCMAAACVRGEVVASWIHDPIGDDTAIAAAGQGAWTEFATGVTTPLRVAAPAPLHEMTGAVSWTYMPEPLRSRVPARLSRLRHAFEFRCAAHQYRMVAAGHAHLLMYQRLLPWDHAPGWLLHREAGGHSARFDGSAYTPTESTGGLIAAPDAATWTLIRDALLTDLEPLP